MKRFTTAAILCSSAIALAACGSGGDSNGGGQSTAADQQAQQPVTLVVSGVPSRTTAESITLKGTASEGAEVTVGGKPAVLHGTHFRARVNLDHGRNKILVEAAKFGTEPAHTAVTIRRVDPAPTTVSQPPAGGSTPPSQPSDPGQGDGNPCPPGQQPVTHMGPTHCGNLQPADPSQCPPGQVPVGDTGACGPPDGYSSRH
jgi:hypothetical protein